MAITFTQERKKQRYLILLLGLVVLLILLVFWWGFLKSEKPGLSIESSLTSSFALPNIQINWQTLRDIQLREFRAFEEILPLEGEIGRENPFIPY